MTLPLIKLSVGLFLSIVIFQQSVVLPASAVEYYVTPVLPNPECPPDKPCFELDQYALKSSQYFSNEDNVTLYFLDGNHTLTQNFSFTGKGIEKLSWLGNLSATSHVHIELGVAVTFDNISDLVMSKLTIESQTILSDDDECGLSASPTSSCYLEEMLFTNMSSINSVIISSEGSIFVTDSTFINSTLSIDQSGSSGDRETVIKNSRLMDSDYGSLFYSSSCTDYNSQFTMVNVTTNHANYLPLNSNGIPLCDVCVTLNGPHKVNITQSSFSRSSCAQAVQIDLIFPPDRVNSTHNGEITISDTDFSGNRHGGLAVGVPPYQQDIQQQRIPTKLNIDNCTFVNNKADTTYDDLFFQTLASTLSVTNAPKLINVVISRSFFRGNIYITGSAPTVFISSNNVTITNCTFSGNTGTALKTYNSHVVILGDVYFTNNVAYEGGGIVLVNSYLHLNDNASVTFYNNTAQHVGGGILVQQDTGAVSPSFQPWEPIPCFYQVKDENVHVSVNMIDNSAKYGGDHIYGASLKSDCSVNNSDANNYISYSYDLWKKVFHFNGSSNLTQVSSDNKRVCQCNGLQMPNCTDLYKIFDNSTAAHRFPGETFTISAALVGDDFGTTSGTIYTRFNSPNPSNFSLLQIQTSQTVNTLCKEIQFTVYSNKTGIRETLVLTPFFIPPSKQSTIEDMRNSIEEYNNGHITDYLLQTPIYIQVYLHPCPPGFVQSNSTCQCDRVLTNNNIDCIIENRTGFFNRGGNVWINGSYYGNGTLNGFILNKFCPHQYCKEIAILIELDKPNVQCAFNRTGTLCGACKEGHSVALGSQTCLNCENNRGVALLVFFLLAGFLLVLFIKFLDLTVTHGTINGLVFYANIVWANQSILFPENKSLAVKILRVFIAWINLDFGIETCFFVGLDAYWKTWMQFLFPFYIWTIAGLIIILCRYSAVVTRLFGRNSVHVLATLILLSYAKLLRTIINIFEVAVLKFPDGHQLIVWALDGNVPYVVSKHGALFCAGIGALLFLWLPYTMALFLVPWLRAKSNWKCLHWINKFQPFFDANFGPLKDRHHYWIGLLLLVRGFLFIIMLLATTSIVTQRVNLATIVITVALLLVHPEPYKRWYLSLLEKSFLFNIIIFCVGIFCVGVDSVGESKTTVTIISLSIAAFQLVVIVLAHAYVTIRRLNMCKKHCPVNNAHTHNIDQTERPRPRLSSSGESRYNLLRDAALLDSDENETD